jgi:hypothetical protein
LLVRFSFRRDHAYSLEFLPVINQRAQFGYGLLPVFYRRYFVQRR